MMPPPEIFSIGAIHIRWYGIFAALTALTTYVLLSKRAPKYGIKADHAAELLMTCVIAGIAGARLEYVRRFWGDYFPADIWGIFRIWEGGLVFQGGFILAAIAVFILCKCHKWQVGAIGDLMAPVIPAGHAVARIGCLLNGCCFGLPWSCGIHYPAGGNSVLQSQILNGQLPADAVAPLPVLPVQAIETLWCLAVAGILYFAERKKLLGGLRFFLYVLLYCVGRFALEFLRGDYPPHQGMTPAQNTTLFVIMPATLAILLFCICYRKKCRHEG